MKDEEFDSDPDSDMDQYMEVVKKHAEVAKTYIRQVNESQGFDVDSEVVPTSFNYFVSVAPLSHKYIQEHYFTITKCCEAAIEFYNSKKRNKTKYEFHKFAYATMGKAAGSIYYLTFHATLKQDGGDKPSVVFEAEVYHRTFGTHVLKVKLCRIKAPLSVKDVRVVGDAVEGNIIEGVCHYVGGRQGPSKFEWFRLNSVTRECVLLLTGPTKYILTREDVGHRLIFKYTPFNSVRKENLDQNGLK